MNKKQKVQIIIPPENGWKPSTLYLVEASFNKNNPIHTYLFYSGFLSQGKPNGYNELHHPGMHESYGIDEIYYMRVLREVLTEKELDSAPNSNKLVSELPELQDQLKETK